MKKFLENVSYSLISNLISMFVGMLSVFIFPKLIGVEDFGYYQLYIFYVTYVTVTALGWPDGIYLKLGGKKYSEIDKEKIGTHFWMLMGTQIVLYVFLFLLCHLITDIDKRCILEVSCICSIIIHSRYFLYLILQATNRIKEYAIIIITERLFSVLFGLFIILCGYRGYLLLIILDVIGRAMSLCVAIYYCRDIIRIKPSIYKELFIDIKSYIRSGSMVLFSTLSSSIIIGIVRYAIENYWDIETFSKISLTISISNMAVRCINSVGIVMFPALRNTDQSKLEKLYGFINTALMTIIFFGLIFYKPFAYLLELWLPNYAESVKYAAILLPVCAYECKNAMLISTYLKALIKEKILLFINVIAILVSFIGTIITIYLIHSIELAVLVILISMMIRCVLGEISIGKLLGMSMSKNIFIEFVMVLIFIISNWYLRKLGIILYIMFYWAYVLLNKQRLIDIKNYILRKGK